MTPSPFAWIALCARAPADAELVAAARDVETGHEAGLLVAWRRDERPPGVDARRVDRRVLDPAGRPGVVSLVLPDEEALVAFDDLGVQQARRRVLAETSYADALSTLLIDDRRFAGSVTVRRGHDAAALLRDDPFARIAPARLLQIDAGLFGRVAPPTGPTIERHGSAQPWPWDRFPA